MLNDTQLVTLRAAIDADPVLVQAISAGSVNVVVDAFNAPASTDFTVWKTSVRTENVFDAISWSALTPADTPNGTAAYTNRFLACQGKQFNLQIMIQGKAAISSGRANIRAGLQDATTNIPSGAGGAPLTGGWLAIKPAMTRPATRIERLFATGTGTAGNPGDLGFEGKVTYQDIEQARNS